MDSDQLGLENLLYLIRNQNMEMKALLTGIINAGYLGLNNQPTLMGHHLMCSHVDTFRIDNLGLEIAYLGPRYWRKLILPPLAVISSILVGMSTTTVTI